MAPNTISSLVAGAILWSVFGIFWESELIAGKLWMGTGNDGHYGHGWLPMTFIPHDLNALLVVDQSRSVFITPRVLVELSDLNGYVRAVEDFSIPGVWFRTQTIFFGFLLIPLRYRLHSLASKCIPNSS